MGRLFWKFFFFILLAQLLATFAIGGSVWLKDRARNQHEANIEMSPPAAYMINAAALSLKYGGVEALREFAKSGDGRHKVFAVDEKGRELFGQAVSPHLREQAKLAESENKNHPVVREVAVDGHTYLLFLIRSGDDKNLHFTPPPGGRPLFPGGPSRYRESGFMQLVPVTSATIASLIFAALLAWYFSKPIRGLRLAFRSAADGKFDVKVGPAIGNRRDELADLGRDFDTMAAQLDALMGGQRRLLHDVSHELRSPLARMQAAIGLAHQQPEKLKSSLDRIQSESERMNKLIDELLTLSRLEAGVVIAAAEDIHIEELIAEIIDDARFEAAAKPCTVVLTGICSSAVRGQAELLHRAIENVVRNAIKHTERESVVTVNCRVNLVKRVVHIDVIDCGPGVTESSLDHIFEPFFRAENSEKNTDGHGLGLTIAKRVIQSMAGSIQAANLPQGGLCVSITLPAEIVA